MRVLLPANPEDHPLFVIPENELNHLQSIILNYGSSLLHTIHAHQITSKCSVVLSLTIGIRSSSEISCFSLTFTCEFATALRLAYPQNRATV